LTGKCITLDVKPTDRIEDVKAMVENQLNVPPDQQRFIFEGRELEDGNTLEDYSVANDSKIHLIFRFRG
jgi:hypothetical protein